MRYFSLTWHFAVKKFTYHRHAQRLEAVKSIIKLKNYAKQYSMLETVLPKMFEVYSYIYPYYVIINSIKTATALI